MRHGVMREPDEVKEALALLGLEATQLWDPVMMGEAARNTCTANDPPSFPGQFAHSRTVRGLREILLPLGWKRNNDKNFSTVVSPDGSFRIAVATGDKNVGEPSVNPKTKNPKGPLMEEAVGTNDLQGELFPELIPLATLRDDATVEAPIGDDCLTWILLFFRAEKEIRAELSLPVNIGEDMRVDAWGTRILLGSTATDPGANLPDADSGPDVDVPVVRR